MQYSYRPYSTAIMNKLLRDFHVTLYNYSTKKESPLMSLSSLIVTVGKLRCILQRYIIIERGRLC